ncbi:diguanylate cyclase domain-containing protein [Actinomycetes bacterium M1A6_2h]
MRSELRERRAWWRRKAVGADPLGLDVVAVQGMSAVTAIMAAAFSVMFVVTAQTPGLRFGVWPGMYDLVVAAIAAATCVATHTRWALVLYRNTDTVTLAASGLVLCSPMIGMWNLGTAYPGTGMVLAIVVAAGFLRRRSYMIATVALADVAWIALAAAVGTSGASVANFAFAIVRVDLVALLLSYIRLRTVEELVLAYRRLETEHDRARTSALTDELTGLANRRGLLAAAHPALDRCATEGRSVAVVYLDVDGLKAINDRLGHARGDEALTRSAGILRSTFGPEAVVARIGGDEFVALLPDATAAPATELGTVAVDALTAVGIQVSAGLAVWTPGAARPDLDDLIDRADRAMYDAKTARRNAG